jgi:hypothetical protein
MAEIGALSGTAEQTFVNDPYGTVTSRRVPREDALPRRSHGSQASQPFPQPARPARLRMVTP